MNSSKKAPERVTIDDVRSKFREVASEVDSGMDAARQGRTIALVAGGVLVVVVVFWLGLRRGRRHQTILEIRRI